jgi:Protein of unknown function (DUF3040)
VLSEQDGAALGEIERRLDASDHRLHRLMVITDRQRRWERIAAWCALAIWCACTALTGVLGIWQNAVTPGVIALFALIMMTLRSPRHGRRQHR